MTSSDSVQNSWRSALLAVMAIGLVVFIVHHLQQEVDQQKAVDAGSWQLAEDTFPGWFPQKLSPALADLHQIPSRVPHDSVHWRDYVRTELLRNPWVVAVEGVERERGRISFKAILRRPALAVRCRGGYLLVTLGGKVIDRVEGYSLDPSWMLPEYSTLSGSDSVDPKWDSLPAGEEWDQLLQLAGDLFDHGILQENAGFVQELRWIPQQGGGFWYLICEGGLRLSWGLADGSGSRLPGAISDKIEALKDVLERKDGLVPLASTINEIVLYGGPAPIIVER
jgi:hypothetical protein